VVIYLKVGGDGEGFGDNFCGGFWSMK
jgi:hypothetical protein